MFCFFALDNTYHSSFQFYSASYLKYVHLNFIFKWKIIELCGKDKKKVQSDCLPIEEHPTPIQKN